VRRSSASGRGNTAAVASQASIKKRYETVCAAQSIAVGLNCDEVMNATARTEEGVCELSVRGISVLP
jgi:hypothetical protein